MFCIENEINYIYYFIIFWMKKITISTLSNEQIKLDTNFRVHCTHRYVILYCVIGPNDIVNVIIIIIIIIIVYKIRITYVAIIISVIFAIVISVGY